MAKIAARSWDEVGVQSFRALVAPMLVDSYALEQQVLTSDLPAQMIKEVGKQDLVGLAVLPGLLRKPLGVSRVLRSPQDFAGARIGIRPGEVSRQTFAALGGQAVTYVPGDPAAVSRLDGAELDVDVIAGNAYDRKSRALTANVDLWPRAVTLVMNKRSFDRLTARQRQALLGASAAAVAPTVKAFAQLDAQTTQVLCQRGLKLVTATDGTYHSTVTRAQLLSNPKFEPGEDNPSNYGQFTLTIGGGRFEWRGSADGIPEGGTASVRGDRVTLRPTFPPDALGQTWIYHWSRYRGVLSFTKVTLGPTFLVVHPWRQ